MRPQSCDLKACSRNRTRTITLQPLHMAAAADAADCVALLLLHGADAGARNACGAAPLQLAKSDAVRGWLRCGSLH